MKLIKTLCALCGKDNSRQLYPANFSPKDLNPKTFSARRLPDRIHYQIVKCQKCGLIYSNPILPTTIISRLYKASVVTYEKQEDDLNRTYGKYVGILTDTGGAGGGTRRREASVFASEHRREETRDRTRKDRRKLLEIGCGNGFFLNYLRKQGWRDVWGVEPSRNACQKAPKALKSRIVNDILKPDLFKPDSFDFICTFQTLDHVTNPNQFLRICRRLLKPGGKMLAINHDVDSCSAKLLGEKSPIIDIEHIYLFNKKTLRQIFEKNGFAVEKIFITMDLHRLGYWARMIPLPKVIKKWLLAVFETTTLSQIAVVIPAGNVGIVASKKL